MVKIVSLNGWGGRLHAELLAYVKAESPDVFCLQEVVVTPDAPSEWLDYRDAGRILPQRANVFAEVASALPDHVGIFCPAARGDLFDGERAVVSFWGLATFVHKSLPIIGQAQGFVHGGYGAHDYGEHPRSRNAHVVRLYDYAGDRPLTIAHMHGLRDLSGKQDIPARIAQAERLAALVRSVAQPGDALVVGGDFNVEPESRTFPILAELGLVDLVVARGFPDTRTSHYAKPGRFADYMLVNNALRDAPFDVVAAPEVSDHRPLKLIA